MKPVDGYHGYEIAVIGMAGRFPGAAGIAEFWDNLRQGREAITFFSKEELLQAGIDPELLDNPRYIRARGVLADTQYFDASFFHYSRAEADIMDPQLRLLHECSWHALEDAGYDPGTFDGPIGLYLGASTHHYWLSRLLTRDKIPSENFQAFSLNDISFMTTQLAYHLDLRGPAISVQTACSTSLVAIHIACQALLSGECRLALAGGVSLRLPQKSGYLFQEGMVMSPDGRCRAFDARAEGAVVGNGMGVVALKPLADALSDHDHIYAVVKGSAVNNDGRRKVGFTAPSVKGQAEVIRVAMQAAGVEPESITYVEAHGTGTRLGDPVEIRALAQAFATSKTGFCRIGSVKTNIGHLDVAAGVTGFIKTVLCLYHREIPPNLHFDTPNPEIDFSATPFVVNTRLTAWEGNGGRLRAGVSSFGIGGTNAHLILEEAPGRGEEEGNAEANEEQLIVLSARTPETLEQMSENLALYLSSAPGQPITPAPLADVSYTLQVGRSAFEHRRMLLAKNSQEAVAALSSPGSKKVRTLSRLREQPRVVFMFAGMGGQYLDMGLGLYRQSPVFRREMDRAAEILRPLLGDDIREILYPGLFSAPVSQKLSLPGISQPLLFAFEYALAAVLLDLGIRPDIMIGYSFGEYTAACLAGVFDLPEALRLIVERGRLIEETPLGAMLSVPLPKEDLDPLLAGEPGLFLAIDNGSSCLVTGLKDTVQAFAERMKEKRVLCMPVEANRALHSPLMDPVVGQYGKIVGGVSLKEPHIPFISNVTGRSIGAREAVSPDYWTRHLAGMVRFAEGIQLLAKEPRSIFLEIGPGRDLSTMIQRYLSDGQPALHFIRPEPKEVSDNAYFLERMGRLWLHGQDIDWPNWYREKIRYRVSLPLYPFEKRAFQSEEESTMAAVPKRPERSGPSSISGRRPGIGHLPHDLVIQEVMRGFSTIFGVEEIGLEEDFFELGGDSLKVITLVDRLHQGLGMQIPIETVFKHPTVQSLARFLGEKTERNLYASIPPVEKRQYYPLTPSQRRLFILDLIEEKNKAYNQPTVLWLEGEIDRERLDGALRALLKRHESLRTGFLLVGDEPVQRIYEELDFELEFFDLDGPKGRKGHKGQTSIESIIEDFIEPFDLSRPPLWRVALVRVEEKKYLLMQNIHHIITDDISLGVIIDELATFYRGETLGPLAVQYKDYALWQQQVMADDDVLKAQEKYWLDRLSGELPLLDMPLDFPRPVMQAFVGAHLGFRFDAGLTRRLQELGQREKTTLFVVLFSMYAALLHRYSGQDDIIIGTPVTGRSHRDLQAVVGIFINTLALRMRLRADMTFRELLRVVKEEVINGFSNQLFQFEEVVERLNIPRDTSRNPLFDTMFIQHIVDLERVDIPGARLSPYEFDALVSKFDLTLDVAETRSGELNGYIEYNTALFSRQSMEWLRRHFIALVESLADDPGQRLKEIDIFGKSGDDDERRLILERFNDTALDFPAAKTVPDLFAGQVDRDPDGIALIGLDLPGGADDSDRTEMIALSYRELDRRTSTLAGGLRARGVGPGAIVGLMVGRNIEMIIGLLGILKAGAAYLPMDPEFPEERLRYMLADSGAEIVINSQTVGANCCSPIQDIGAECKGERQFAPTDPAYVIYTSGSTGRPKGVIIGHRAVVNFIVGITRIIPFTRQDVIMSLTTISFDIFGLETLLPLTCGTKVILGSEEEQLNTIRAAHTLGRQQVTLFQVTPSRLALWLSSPGGPESLEGVKYLLVGGEAFPAPLLLKVRAIFRGRIFNMYGPTETTIWSLVKELTGEVPLTIGRPIANTGIYVLNRENGLQPIGVPGELWISGPGLSPGYLNNPEMTAEKFVGGLYKTGDVGRWLPTGEIEFLGRVDHQVKIRGYRIELEEIEKHLLSHESVKEAVVLAEGEAENKYLAAYLVAAGELNVSWLRDYLLKKVPMYMLPAEFIQVDRIPQTPNGKVDRKALKKWGGERLTAVKTYAPPDTEMEKQVAGVWQDILDLDRVGREDNFFDLGGTSLKVIMAATRLQVILDREIPVVVMFRYPTVVAMSRFLDLGEATGQTRDRSAARARGRERVKMKRQVKKLGLPG